MNNSDQLLSKIQSYNKFSNTGPLSKAYNFALEAHKHQKRVSGLPYIVHQGDLMAARIEFEREWLPKLRGEEQKEDNFKLKTTNKTTKDKALGSIKSSGLNDLLQGL